MRLRSLYLTVALGLLVSSLACVDQGTMAPDDLQPQFAKPAKVTADVTISEGMDGEFLNQPINRDDKKQLQFNLDQNGPTTNLTQTHESYGTGICLIQNGDLYDQAYEEALAHELIEFGSSIEWLGTNVVIDKLNLGGESEVHMISLNYTLVDNLLGTINLRIGGGMVFSDQGVTVEFNKDGDDTTEDYTFSGGWVGVVSRAAQIKEWLRIECPLRDEVTVVLDRNN